ncbi:MAG TPA: hypothetical protein VFR09_06375 [Alphaproteobacteria bacterium]|nr:hypothetical protein [Alphaproteobacteria bacterium]
MTKTSASAEPHFRAAAHEHNFSINKQLFVSPAPAGRKITAGFSFLQRLGKGATVDVWFPQALQAELDELVAKGAVLGPDNFPAEWAAVRQFELLQDAGNYKIYDMNADYLTRSLWENARNHKGGGYRVTVATIGSYLPEHPKDDLEILDRRLQKRIAHLIHMLYLEEQSASINEGNRADLAEGKWSYETALPHVGMTLGARDLFRPMDGSTRKSAETFSIPSSPNEIVVKHAALWTADLGVTDGEYNQPLAAVNTPPRSGQYRVHKGVYQFARADAGREVTISYMHNSAAGSRKLSESEKKHKLAQKFFDVLSLLPQSHIVHDTAIGLQLPESINEQEWIYLVGGHQTQQAFNTLLTDLFAPFDKISMGKLDGRADAGSEIKATTQHARSYGDRLTPEAEAFQRQVAQFALH